MTPRGIALGFGISLVFISLSNAWAHPGGTERAGVPHQPKDGGIPLPPRVCDAARDTGCREA